MNSGQDRIIFFMKEINLLTVTMSIVGKRKLTNYYRQYFQYLCLGAFISHFNTFSFSYHYCR